MPHSMEMIAGDSVKNPHTTQKAAVSRCIRVAAIEGVRKPCPGKTQQTMYQDIINRAILEFAFGGFGGFLLLVKDQCCAFPLNIL